MCCGGGYNADALWKGKKELKIRMEEVGLTTLLQEMLNELILAEISGAAQGRAIKAFDIYRPSDGDPLLTIKRAIGR